MEKYQFGSGNSMRCGVGRNKCVGHLLDQCLLTVILFFIPSKVNGKFDLVRS